MSVDRWELHDVFEHASDVAAAVSSMIGIWDRDTGAGPDRYIVAFDPSGDIDEVPDPPEGAGAFVCDPREAADALWTPGDSRWLFVPSDTCDWLLNCSAQMPSDVTCDVDELAPSGVVLLESQIPSPGADGEPCPLHAIAWKVLSERRSVVLFFVATVGELTVPVGFSLWTHGCSVDDADGLSGDPDSHSWDRRFVAAAWHLASRDDVATTAALPRPVRRRATRAGRTLPPVRVLHLGAGDRNGGSEGVERGPAKRHWWVSGHWRSQPYGPGRALRRPTWIETHLAGNRAGPLVEPRPTAEVLHPPQR